jgi:hypothetical protein
MEMKQIPRHNNPKPRKYRKKGGFKGNSSVRKYWRLQKREQRAKEKEQGKGK